MFLNPQDGQAKEEPIPCKRGRLNVAVPFLRRESKRGRGIRDNSE